MNGPKSIGVGALPVNNVGGIRMNTAVTYLDTGQQRPNLTVQGGALVLRMLLVHALRPRLQFCRVGTQILPHL